MPYSYREHFPFRLNIRNKVIIPFLVLALVITALSLQAVTGILRSRTEELIVGDMRSSTGTVQGLMEDDLREMSLVLEALTSGGGPTDAGNCLPPGAKGLMEKAGLEVEVGGARPEAAARIITVSPPGMEMSFGHWRHGPTGDWRIFASAPCPGDPGRAIVVHRPLGLPFWEKVKKATGLEVIVYELSGRMVAATFDAAALPRAAGELPPPGAPAEGEEKVGHLEMAGSSYTYYAYPFKAGGERILDVVFVRADTDLVRWQAVVRRDLLFFAAAIAVFFVAVYTFLINRITRPVHQLMRAAEKVASGDFSAGSAINSLDEIGRLAEAFRKMTASMRRYQLELQEATHKIIHQEKLASLGQMVAGIMHEIRNPLNSLGILMKLAEREDKPEERKTYFAKMEEEARRISRTVEQFLDIARKPRFTVEEVDVNERINVLLSRMDSLLAAQGIETRTGLAGDLPRLILDKGRLDQVLYNLVFNSLQAMKDGGILTLTTGLVEAVETGDEAERPCVSVTVADTGEGIPPENIEKVFDPFFTSKPPGEGTGLGLSIVKSVVEEHGGRIRLSSRPGRGTEVEIRFPC